MRKPGLKKNVVLFAIEVYFQKPSSHYEDMLHQMETAYSCNEILIGKMKYRLYKLEIMRGMVELILQQVEEIKRRSFILRYREKLEWVGVSMKLHVSVAQLNLWNKEILKMIANMLVFQITKDDLLHLNKLWSMYVLVDQRIELLSEKPFCLFADQHYLQKLTKKKQEILHICALICDYISSLSESKRREIILMKLQNPHMQHQDIAAQCNTSMSLVATYITAYKNTVMKQHRRKRRRLFEN